MAAATTDIVTTEPTTKPMTNTQAAYLWHYSQLGSNQLAAKAVGVHETTPLRWKRENESFRAIFEDHCGKDKDELKPQQWAFLEALRETGTITGASTATGTNPKTHYYWLETSEAYKEEYRIAMESVIDRHEGNLDDIAFNGEEERNRLDATKFKLQGHRFNYKSSANTTVNVGPQFVVREIAGVDVDLVTGVKRVESREVKALSSDAAGLRTVESEASSG